ncbi:MAG: methionine adenosyltransferase [Patescibacteria group bacterium]
MSLLPATYTAESVTSGHPDKICDAIADSILDSCLQQDSESRVAVECFGSHGQLFIGGEVTTQAHVDYKTIAQHLYSAIGYEDNLDITVAVAEQSSDIADGIKDDGAGDQGIMYGYACNSTEEFLPLGVVLAHKLTQRLEFVRRQGVLPWLRPDGKAQVTISNGRVVAVVVSTQHSSGISLEELRAQIIQYIVEPLIDVSAVKSIYINPAGTFTIGGFAADSGLTGRKIMVDTYGGVVVHGGGSFSGKDASKVDRSGAYMARYAAKSIVSQGNAKECLVSVAYAIGKKEPVMLMAVNENGEDIQEIHSFDFKPKSIISHLGLLRPIFGRTSNYGHFGKNIYPWENV